jgi:transcriptional repressor NrdR
VSADDLERLVDRVERHVQEQGEKEVTSSFIGERMLDELVNLDPLAAARFASVFRNFQGAEDYTSFFASIESSKTGRES